MAQNYPDFFIQQTPSHQFGQSYNPLVNEIPRQRKPKENPKDYMLSSYIMKEHVLDINSSTSIYRLDPFVKYLCAWTTDVCTEELNAIKERITWKQPNLVSFLFYEEEPERFKMIKIFYEFMPLDLKQILDKRAITKQYVPEDELLTMIQGLTSAFTFLQQRGIHHSALSLQSVFFDEEFLVYRIQDISPFKAKGHILQTCYPAPECVCPINKFKSDVFSLGIIILSLMLLKDLSFVYINNSILDIQRLEKQIQEMEKVYLGPVKNLVKLMVMINPIDRPDWIELQQKVSDIQILPLVNRSDQNSQKNGKQEKNIFLEEQLEINNQKQVMEYRRMTFNENQNKNKKSDLVNNRLESLNRKIQETLAKSQQQGGILR